MGVGPGDRVTSLRLRGLIRGAFKTEVPVQVGPLTFGPRTDGSTQYEVAAQPVDFDWADTESIYAFASAINLRVAATITLAWRAAVQLSAWTDISVMVDGEWYQQSTGEISSGRIVAALTEAPSVDPAVLWDAPIEELTAEIGMLSIGLLAAQTLPNGGPLSVPAMTVVMESTLGKGTNLDDAANEADRLRSVGWAIAPNPDRAPQRIRSGVAHHTPKDPLPTPEEVEWMHQVAFGMVWDRLGLAP